MDHFVKISDLECECIGWCRASITPFTNHHPNCEKYNDSLIDVWYISNLDAEDGFYDDNYKRALSFLSDGLENDENLEIRHEKMHKEVYDNMKEFQGF